MEQFDVDSINFSSEIDVKHHRDMVEAARVENLKLTLNAILFKEKLFKTFCGELKKFQSKFNPSPIEKNLDSKKNELSQSNISKLLSDLKLSQRPLDLHPCKEALKEKWAIWFSEQCIDSLNADEEKALIRDLKELMQREGENLLSGECQNFYHLISGAMTRSITFNESDPNFVMSSWNAVSSSMRKMDKSVFGSSASYQRYLNQQSGWLLV